VFIKVDFVDFELFVGSYVLFDVLYVVMYCEVDGIISGFDDVLE